MGSQYQWHWYCDSLAEQHGHNINDPWGHNINGPILAKFRIGAWDHNINGIDIVTPWSSKVCTISMVHGCIISMVRFGKVWGWDMGSQYQWHWYCGQCHLAKDHNINGLCGHNINGQNLAKFWIETWAHNINGIDIVIPWTSNVCTISMVHGVIISMFRFG